MFVACERNGYGVNCDDALQLACFLPPPPAAAGLSVPENDLVISIFIRKKRNLSLSLSLFPMDLDNLSDHSVDLSDADEFEEDAAEKLSDGTVSALNRNGELWCPFCAGRKKTQYKFQDLLQHAEGVGKGARGPEAVGFHRALAKHLKEKMSHLAEPAVQRYVHLEQETPERVVSEEKLVWPWMGVIVNIDNSKICDGKRVGPGNNEIKCKFSSFHPRSVHTLWNHLGHRGMAVVEFGNDMTGYGHAQDFARSFSESGRGKKDWERMNATSSSQSPTAEKQLYGWLANQQDYCAEDAIGKYLRDKGDLRTVAEVNETTKRQQDLILQDLDATIQNQNQMFQEHTRQLFQLVTENVIARRFAELQKTVMEQRHREEIIAIEEKTKQAVKVRDEEMKREREKWALELQRLQQREKELEKQEVCDDEGRIKNELEKRKNEKKMELLQQIAEFQQHREAKRMQLVKKQEDESSNLLKEQMRLVSKHKLEQEIEDLEAMIVAKKLEVNESEDSMQVIKNLEEQLANSKEEMEGLQDINSSLVSRERKLNDELQEAMKVAVKILEERGDNRSIGVKRMGELDIEPWTKACKEKFKDDPEGWEMQKAKLVSQWEDHIADAHWHPFKHVKMNGDGKYEERINEEDERLQLLRNELGDIVCKTVEVALMELQEHNASGRYPIAVSWNFLKKRRATMAEIINYLGTAKPAAKRRRV